MDIIFHSLDLNLQKKFVPNRLHKKRAKGASGVEQSRICRLRPKVVSARGVHGREQGLAESEAGSGEDGDWRGGAWMVKMEEEQ